MSSQLYIRYTLIMAIIKHWKYKNLTFLTLSLAIAYFVFQVESLHTFLLHLGTFGYLGAFIAGMLFVSTFTIAIGTVILLVLAETYSALEIGIIAGLGAVVGDLVIFRIVRDNLLDEITEIYNKMGGPDLAKLFHTSYFSWVFPVFGAIVITSPLPDELGVSLMGISKMKTYQFVILSFILNAFGIFLTIAASRFIKP